MSNEPFLNYLGFMSGRQRLIISAPQIGNDEKPLSMSPYMIDLAMAFDRWDADKKRLRMICRLWLSHRIPRPQPGRLSVRHLQYWVR